ncbi:hypothetical protein [uncultured Tateyamaria sp.]|uniref:hypothetical protein n=1 Tax=uncultured Tateyamaria sp. TaxID=455651 RepID=UPI0026177441|nr:hypothetical protein [uncultured Tateyamaria sp.]
MKIDHRLETTLSVPPQERSEDMRANLAIHGEGLAIDFRHAANDFLRKIKDIAGADHLPHALDCISDLACDFEIDEHMAEGFQYWNDLRACEADITPVLAEAIRLDAERAAQLVRDRRARLDAEAPLTPLMEACGEVE